MVVELKIRIKDYKKIERRLENLGATFIQELNCIDTYFKQPSGKVLKIVQDERGNFISRLKEKNEKFEIVRKKKIENVVREKELLTDTYGIKTILKKKRRKWELGDTIFDFNLIENVGEFLIIKNENPKKETVTGLLGIENPEYITIPFSELKKK